jgi:hypothetical protein
MGVNLALWGGGGGIWLRDYLGMLESHPWGFQGHVR